MNPKRGKRRIEHKGQQAFSLLLILAMTCLTGCPPTINIDIERVEPNHSDNGDIVVIQGYGFGLDQASSTVSFSSTEATDITSWADNAIGVRVPGSLPYDAMAVTVRVLPDNVEGHSFATSPFRTASITHRLLAFGDSITKGNLLAPQENYGHHIESILDSEKGPSVVINSGVNAEGTHAGLARFESSLNTWNDIEYVLLMEGTNDVTDTTPVSLESSIANLRDMINIARVEEHDLTVVLGTILPRQSYGTDQESPTTYELVEAIRDLYLDEYSLDDKVILADHYQYFIDTESWEQYFQDGLHPNQQGYELLADSWYYGVLEHLIP